MNIFQSSHDYPYHLSIGAVLLNDQGEVCVHYFAKHANFTDFYILMRETMEPGESIEATLRRGLREEFNATAEVEGFLGPIVSHFPNEEGVMITKTTLYFVCRLTSQDIAGRNRNDEEGHSEIRWATPAMLIPLMKEQGKRLGREDIDESDVLERLIASQRT